MKTIIKNLIIIMFLSISIFANATVGSITSLKGDVKINDNTSSVQASLGLKLYEKNSILTGKKSKAQFIFNDETIVTVGKNSNFSISKFIYDESQEPTIEFGLIKGAIKTITGEIGKIAPQKFSVKTKTATIGIRGTNFTISILDDKSLMAYCTYGAINVNYNGKDYLVEQGFHILISPDGTVKIKEFNSHELRDMSAKLFGSMGVPKGKVREDGYEPRGDMIIDETTEVITDVIITDVSDELKDKEQADKQDEANEHDEYDDNLLPQPQPPVADIIMNGYDVARNSNNAALSPFSGAVNFTIINNSTFDATSNLIDIDQDGAQWTYLINSTPTSYTSRDDFETNFVSVTSSDSAYSNFSINPSKNYFRALSDLETDDYMSWGEWGVDVSFDYFTSPSSRDIDGFWIAGEATDAAIVAAMTGTVNYAGIYQLIVEDGFKLNGTATMQIDFSSTSSQVALNILNYDGSGNSNESFTMDITGNTMSGNQNGQTGRANGTFYGPTADSVGGSFLIQGQSGNVDATGVYQVKQQ